MLYYVRGFVLSPPYRYVAYLEAHPEVVLCSCDYQIIDPEGRHKKCVRRSCPPDLIRWQLMFYNYIAGPVMYRRDVALELDGYDEADLYTEDYGLCQRMAAKGHLAILPDELYKYRYHEESISRQKASEQAAYTEKLVARGITNLLGYALDRPSYEICKLCGCGGCSKTSSCPRRAGCQLSTRPCARCIMHF